MNKRRGAVSWALLCATLTLSFSIHFLHNHGFAEPPASQQQYVHSHEYSDHGAEAELCPVVRLLVLQGIAQSDPVTHEYLAGYTLVSLDDHLCYEVVRYTPSRGPPQA